MDSHLAWHLALDELDRGNTQRSMQLYEQRVRPAVHPGVQLIVLLDAASLVWRWQILGLQPPTDASRAISDYAAARIPRAGGGKRAREVVPGIACLPGQGIEIEWRVVLAGDQVARAS